MGFDNFSSDYGGSGSSMNSSWSWGSLEPGVTKASSFADLVNGRCTLEDVMQEFRRNGYDAPFNPDDELRRQNTAPSAGPAYLRQRSWPAPERSPAPRLPRPNTVCIPTASTHANVDVPDIGSVDLTEEQRRVLCSLPDSAVVALLREMQRREKKHPEVCRFCKNNGERESYYRSHALRDARGRVACPVLRAFVCSRCGARGDNAHTIKYCPLTTCEERIKSTAMMRSVRMSSVRRRAPEHNYVLFGAAPPSVLLDSDALPGHVQRAPLDPQWAALERKLLL